MYKLLWQTPILLHARLQMAKLITPGKFLHIQTLINPIKNLPAWPAGKLHNRDYGIFFTGHVIAIFCKGQREQLFWKMLQFVVLFQEILTTMVPTLSNLFQTQAKIMNKYNQACAEMLATLLCNNLFFSLWIDVWFHFVKDSIIMCTGFYDLWLDWRYFNLIVFGIPCQSIIRWRLDQKMLD